MKLTDLEICKLIAEIEGKGRCFPWFDTYAIKTERYEEREEYNPLTDDGLCFQLMVKYSVDVIHDGIKQALIYNDPEDNPIGKAVDKNMNKAICLAIIEATNETN